MIKSKNEKGSILLETALIFPALLALVLMLAFFINMFIVQSTVKYALNQTVNELGSYTYLLDFFGLVDKLNGQKEKFASETVQLHEDIDQFNETYSSVMNLVNSTKDTAGKIQQTVTEGNFTLDNAEKIEGDIDELKKCVEGTKKNMGTSWDTIKGYAKDPSTLINMLKNQLGSEAIDAAGTFLGGCLGKSMMYAYANGDFLVRCGVVSTAYDINNTDCPAGIDGMDFSKSIILGDSRTVSDSSSTKADSRVIDIVVVYRLKFPVNFGKLIPGLSEDSALYKNSLLIVQRAAGYGWINGDGCRHGKEYNKE